MGRATRGSVSQRASVVDAVKGRSIRWPTLLPNWAEAICARPGKRTGAAAQEAVSGEASPRVGLVGRRARGPRIILALPAAER
jgi:hypothetical protein